MAERPKRGQEEAKIRLQDGGRAEGQGQGWEAAVRPPERAGTSEGESGAQTKAGLISGLCRSSSKGEGLGRAY